jgi:hypothetical protein
MRVPGCVYYDKYKFRCFDPTIINDVQVQLAHGTRGDRVQRRYSPEANALRGLFSGNNFIATDIS